MPSRAANDHDGDATDHGGEALEERHGGWSSGWILIHVLTSATQSAPIRAHAVLWNETNEIVSTR